MAGDDERKGVGRQGAANRTARPWRPDAGGEPGIGGDATAGHPGLGEQDPALELRALVKGEDARVEANRLAGQEAGEIGRQAAGRRMTNAQ